MTELCLTCPSKSCNNYLRSSFKKEIASYPFSDVFRSLAVEILLLLGELILLSICFLGNSEYY